MKNIGKLGSEKEFIFSLYLKKYPKVLEKEISLKLSNIQLEVPLGRKKIDYLSISKSRRLTVIVENQLTPSDKYHLDDKIMPILYSTRVDYESSSINNGQKRDAFL
ncbi:hypothetical protein BTO30_13200 [Domibacillus antri]|uniref:Transposase (putative) YhgA-like domain-containing protein n=1 Tax=Domibacillus antri TaxID=1714264 RepID=A0A1Q8Q315_9BACI|nr:hypothetical protein [Domibacillus antri]OLN21750.1 hypothetical protein BTO30_13200 [Domibacillus antri]